MRTRHSCTRSSINPWLEDGSSYWSRRRTNADPSPQWMCVSWVEAADPGSSGRMSSDRIRSSVVAQGIVGARFGGTRGEGSPGTSPEAIPCDTPKRREPRRGAAARAWTAGPYDLPARGSRETLPAVAIGEAILPAVARGIDPERRQAGGVLVAEDDAVQRHRLGRELHALHVVLAAIAPARAGELLRALVAAREVVLRLGRHGLAARLGRRRGLGDRRRR